MGVLTRFSPLDEIPMADGVPAGQQRFGSYRTAGYYSGRPSGIGRGVSDHLRRIR